MILLPPFDLPLWAWGCGRVELRVSGCLITLRHQRAIKRVVRPRLGLKSFACSCIVIAGIETMHMIRKGQLQALKEQDSAAADQVCSLAF